ncbi:uncharacterized protein LOC135071713 [Ostrinia nubilalis]|uniref:uncharacterized protein LOC135071713 n=1 Tax=Ostrinia nubilalis TaxID=29057 RepID=UPI0030822D50
MDDNIVANNVSVLAILDSQSAEAYKPSLSMTEYHTHNHEHSTINHSQTHSHTFNQEEIDGIENNKQSIVWTKNSTITLLSLYETKMSMLDNPKKKSKMWTSIAEELKAMGIEVTPDQVRWKINALTKKYKDCIDNGQGSSAFKYFNEMNQILGLHSDASGTYRLASGVMHGPESSNKERCFKNMSMKNSVPYRKLRAERKAKIELDKQWIEYIQKQDEQRNIRDERFERNLRLREEELQLRKKELEMKHSLALKKLQLRERKQEEMLKIEREKCALLRKLLANQS